jgi:CubicO group peptidase (beta-lactamase class C family)
MSGITKKLQAVLDAQIGRGGIHNIVAAIQSHDRSIDFAGAAGIANPQTRSAMTLDTPYFIASVTKMFTAAIIMSLHEKKCLDLDAPISEYLPASLTRGIHTYKGTDHSSQIKVCELVNQSSGLADFEVEKPRGGKSVMDGLKAGHDRSIDIGRLLKSLGSVTPFSAGTQQSILLNMNYRLWVRSSDLLQTIHGSNFDQRIIKQRSPAYVLADLMPHTAGNPATVYYKDAPANIKKYLSSNVSDGGLISTASESMIFLRAFFEGQLFDKMLFERMMNWNSIFFPLRYGYGLMYFHLPRFFWPSPLPEFIGHSGTTGSFAFTCPSRSMYLVGTLNQVSPAKPFFLMIDLIRAIN